MNRLNRVAAFLLIGVASAALQSAEPLKIVVNEKGLESLIYRGIEYCDPSGAGAVGFTGGHDYGNLWSPAVLDPQKGKSAFAIVPLSATVKENTVTQTYPWGTLIVSYTPKDDDLYITATLANTSQSPIGWWKANLFQFNARLVFDGNRGRR